MKRNVENRVVDSSLLLTAKPEFLSELVNGMVLADGSKPYLLHKKLERCGTVVYGAVITNCSPQIAQNLSMLPSFQTQHIRCKNNCSALYSTLIRITDPLLDAAGRKRLPQSPVELVGYLICDGHVACHYANKVVISVSNRTAAEVNQFCQAIGIAPIKVSPRKDGKRHDITFDKHDIDCLVASLTQ